ncbi:MAG TPA: isoprenylcysteine carboxylmethyltransferase family protein [Dehalococcoidales bacterium]|nr:isoprenylcysteine carboxylmethyltransferase family protein [Dehalococcoidales bacterium]
MNIETVAKISLIVLYSLFSLIRIEYYRRAKKAGFKTVIEEKRRYSLWLSLFICYEVLTFFIFIFSPETLGFGVILLPVWVRLAGALLGFIALLWFLWIHQALGNNLSVRISIKDAQQLVTHGPYRWVRHPMYTAFFILHIAAFLLTSNWFIGLTWTAGLAAIIFTRVKREEEMLLNRFGKAYSAYANNTGRFIPRLNWTGFRPEKRS